MKKFLAILLLLATLFCVSCQNGNHNVDGNEGTTVKSEQNIDDANDNENDNNSEDGNYKNNVLSPLPTDKYSTVTLSTKDNVKAVHGAWKWENSVLVGNNASAGNCFTLTELYSVPGVSFEFEADIEIISGQAAGLVFGVTNRENPGAHWYCVNVDMNAKNVRLFSSGTGTTVGNGANTKRGLTAEEQNLGKYHIKITMNENRDISFSLNGSTVASYRESNYSGGYLGFNSYRSVCEFSNITYKMGDMYSAAFDIEMNIGKDSYTFDANSNSKYIDLGKPKGDATISFKLLEGYTAQIGDKVFSGADVKHICSIPYGASTVSIITSDSKANKNAFTLALWRSIPDDEVYMDFYRPQYHFSPQMGFMNDPNGLVYNATTEEYHLFYQYNPKLDTMGNQVWGHAVSKDLVNWKEIGIAIDREPHEKIYSGCAVIDYNNTSGFFDESIPPSSRMVVFYTIPFTEKDVTPETQNIAYSLDNGYTWIKYEGNPVLSPAFSVSTFRDPKVQWIEDPTLPGGGIWMMVVAGSKAQIYTSHDLKNWTYNSTIKDINGVDVGSECPDLFKLNLDGNEDKVKWVYSGAGVFYIVGDLVRGTDGKYTFLAEQAKRTDYVYTNGRYYATQSYFNTKNGDVVTFSWVKDINTIGGKSWVGSQSLPYKVGLVRMNDGSMRLTHIPIDAVDLQRGDKLISFGATTLNEGAKLSTVEARTYSIDTCFTLEKGTEARLELFVSNVENGIYLLFERDIAGRVTLTIDTTAISKIPGKQWTIPIECEDGKIVMKLYADASILEFFVNDGRYAFCDRIYPTENSDSIIFEVEVGKVNLEYFRCYDMSSIWCNEI